jgi:hypothetical protein
LRGATLVNALAGVVPVFAGKKCRKSSALGEGGNLVAKSSLLNRQFVPLLSSF